MLTDAQYAAILTMFLDAVLAPAAVAASDVDLANDPLPYPLFVLGWRAIDDTHELVAWNAVEARVAFQELQVRSADARHRHPNATEPLFVGCCNVAETKTLGPVCEKRSHRHGQHGQEVIATDNTDSTDRRYHQTVYGQRQLRLRVLEALEQRVKQFAIREDLWPLRVPNQPLSLDDMVSQVLGNDVRAFDILSLRSRTLLHLAWDDSSWDAWVIVLPSKLKLFCDTSHEESRILASGGRNEGDESDRIFLELLSDSAGEHFGIEMAGGPPSRVRSSIADRDFLATIFVNLFEVTGMESELRQELVERGAARSANAAAGGADLRVDVEEWLPLVLS